MRGNCTICTEYFGKEQDISATWCGHVFHEKCLSHWFIESKSRRTCPQCRTKLKADQVIPKLFVNFPECADVDLDPYQLKEDLEECQIRERNLISEKNALETTVKNMRKTHRELKDINKTLRIDVKDLKQRHDGLIDSMKILQSMAEDAKEAKAETLSLREKLKSCTNIERILDSGKADVADMLRRYSNPCDVKELASWCSSLKQEYDVIRQSRDNTKLDLMKLKKSYNHQQKELNSKMSELKDLQELLDLQKRSENQVIEENSSLRKKVDALNRAISSPSETRSSAISRLIAESPAPSAPYNQSVTPDVLKTNSKRPKLTNPQDDQRKVKKQNSDPETEYPQVKIVDTTNLNAYDQEQDDSFLMLSGVHRGNISRSSRIHQNIGRTKSKSKPFGAMPVMSSSLRPSINLIKKRNPR